MTTSVTVKCHNYPVRINTVDVGQGINGQDAVSVKYLEAGEKAIIYCTTTRKLEIQDIEYDEMKRIKELEL